MNEKKAINILLLMGLLCFFLFFGLVFGPKHPQIFFWGTLISCCAIIINVTSITKKQFFKLCIMLGLAAVIYEKIDEFITNWIGKYSWLSFIVSCILLAPCYVPVATYFFRICTQEDMENADKK